MGNFSRAVKHFQSGRHRLAEKICLQLLKRSPEHQEALEMCALIALQQRRWSVARLLLERLLKIAPDHALALSNLGLACLELGDADAALRHGLQATTLAPQDADANNNLGRTHQALGNLEQALACYVVALQASPWNPLLQVNAGAVCQLLGRSEAAIDYYDRALEIQPEIVEVHNNLGILQLDRGQYRSALAHFQRALQQQETADIQNHIGLTRMALEQLEQARSHFSRALELDPAHQDALFNWAWFEEYHNNLELANQVFEHGAKGTTHLGLIVLQSTLARRKQDCDAAWSVLERLEDITTMATSEQVLYLFEKGTVLDGLGRYHEAFVAFKEANACKNRVLDGFDEAADRRQCDQLQAIFTAQNEQTCWKGLAISTAPQDDQLPRPIFIVGFPRSGTSLLAQMLSRHDQVIQAGEMPGILDLADAACQQILDARTPYPDCLVDPASPLTQALLQQLRAQYYASLPEPPSTAAAGTWFVDKMPHNALHLGLIHLLFPEAPIIHLSRHPLDACLSAYFANFEQHRYTESLPSTARHYQRMMNLIAHYRQNPRLRLMEIRYQDLVSEPLATLQPLLAQIGLPWEDRCLTPEYNRAHVKTRSYAQVKAAIHTGSVDRYRHYRDDLQPIVHLVQAAMQQYGYSY